ncbi:hypothetical protein MC885_017053, partial [Smutsia gigantea]
ALVVTVDKPSAKAGERESSLEVVRALTCSECLSQGLLTQGSRRPGASGHHAVTRICLDVSPASHTALNPTAERPLQTPAPTLDPDTYAALALLRPIAEYAEMQGKDGLATALLATRNPAQLLQASQTGRSTLDQITVKSPGAVTGKASAGKKRKTGIFVVSTIPPTDFIL